MNEPVKTAGSRGYKVNPEPVPSVEETLEHLERTLDDLDPVDSRSDADKAADEAAARMVAEGGPVVLTHVSVEPLAAAIDAEADRIISEITGDASVEAVEPVNVPEGTDDDKAGE